MTTPATPTIHRNPGTFRLTFPWLKVSFHHYDWAPFLQLTRPATHWVRRARLLGLGFDIDWNQSQRVYTVSVGLRRLFNLSWAYQAGPAEGLKRADHLIKDRAFIQFDLLFFSLSWSPKEVRLFFRDRPFLPKPQPKD